MNETLPTLTSLLDALEISAGQAKHWCEKGYIRPISHNGQGRARRLEPAEVDVLRKMAAFVRDGVTPRIAAKIARREYHPTEPPSGRPNPLPLAIQRLRAACWRGEEPAEALTLIDPGGVDHLVYDLWLQGWTDVEIATHTSMTTYTTSRIRERLGLAPHQAWKEAAA